MGYKILYVEDLEPESIIDDLRKQKFSVSHCDPDNFEQTDPAIEKWTLC